MPSPPAWFVARAGDPHPTTADAAVVSGSIADPRVFGNRSLVAGIVTAATLPLGLPAGLVPGPDTAAPGVAAPPPPWRRPVDDPPGTGPKAPSRDLCL